MYLFNCVETDSENEWRATWSLGNSVWGEDKERDMKMLREERKTVRDREREGERGRIERASREKEGERKGGGNTERERVG